MSELVSVRPESLRWTEIHDLVTRIERAEAHGRSAINLVPSENRVSPLSARAMRGDFGNRYFFNDTLAEDEWYFRGGESVGDIQVRSGIAALSRLAGAEHVNLRPISGMTAMVVVLLGLGGPPGSTIVSVDPASGGHYATAALIERLGRKTIVVRHQAGRIDPDALRAALAGQRVALVYLDLQNCLHELNAAEVVAIVREHSPETRVHVDCSHTLGLVLGRAHTNPLDAGADSMGGSTHKSFPGPQKGVLFTRDAKVAEDLRAAQFHSLSSHHFASTLGLCVTASEFEVFGRAYAAQVLRNAEALGIALAHRGFTPIREASVITRTHQLWLSLGTDEEAIGFSDALAAAGIRTNVLPDIPETDGLTMRIGVSEMTFEGATERSMAELADIFATVRDGRTERASSMRQALRHGFGAPFYFPDPA